MNINTIGIYNINPFLPVTFKKTANEIKTIAANNWLADPNNGQILTYPPKLNKYPQTKEIIVETYLLVQTLTKPLRSSPSSTSKNTFQHILEILATASNEVKARAETNIVIMHNPHD